MKKQKVCDVGWKVFSNVYIEVWKKFSFSAEFYLFSYSECFRTTVSAVGLPGPVSCKLPTKVVKSLKTRNPAATPPRLKALWIIWKSFKEFSHLFWQKPLCCSFSVKPFFGECSSEVSGWQEVKAATFIPACRGTLVKSSVCPSLLELCAKTCWKVALCDVTQSQSSCGLSLWLAVIERWRPATVVSCMLKCLSAAQR